MKSKLFAVLEVAIWQLSRLIRTLLDVVILALCIYHFTR